MKTSTEPLAWRKSQGSEDLYTTSDLKDPEKVKEIFAACKQAQGYITANGWAFLFSSWNLKSLLELDLDTGWFHSGNVEESSAHLIYQSLMSGYNPTSGEKGDYDPDSGLFLSLKGRKEKIDWDKIIAEGS